MKPEAVKDRRWLRVVAGKHPLAWSLDRAAQDLNRQGNQPAQMVMPVRIVSNGHQFGIARCQRVLRTWDSWVFGSAGALTRCSGSSSEG